MNVNIRNSNKFGALTEARLESFEADLGSRLPEDYRAYMLEHNGGRPEPDYFEFMQHDIESASTLSHLYPLHDGTSRSWYATPLQQMLTADYIEPALRKVALPIGQDPYGNVILLHYAGSNTGAVSFFDHEEGTVHKIADSFRAFLDALRPDPDPEEPNYGTCPMCQHDVKDVGPDGFPIVGCPSCGWGSCSQCEYEFTENAAGGCPECGWGRE